MIENILDNMWNRKKGKKEEVDGKGKKLILSRIDGMYNRFIIIKQVWLTTWAVNRLVDSQEYKTIPQGVDASLGSPCPSRPEDEEGNVLFLLI